MISENISTACGNMSYRNITGFYFAKWFDEPFTVDFLNMIKPDGISDCTLSGFRGDDFNHIDFRFYDGIGILFTVDCKTYSHNYEYIRTKERKLYADCLVIGKDALFSKTDYLSICYDKKLCFVPRNDVACSEPLRILENAKGQNGHAQDLYIFDMNNIMKLERCRLFSIPGDMWDCYQDGFDIFVKYKKIIEENNKFKKKVDDVSLNMVNLGYMENMRQELIQVIKKYNTIIPNSVCPVDLDSELDEINALIS